MHFIKYFCLFLLASTFLSCSDAVTDSKENVEDNGSANKMPAVQAKEQRIVSLNGTITELLYFLGYANELVGVDVTSSYPEQVNKLPKLGHVRSLNAESILAMKPTLIFIDQENAKSKALERLEKSGIQIVVIEMEHTLDNATKAANQIIKVMAQEGDKMTILANLQERVNENKEKLKVVKAKMSTPPKVLFIYARGTKQLMVAGKNTFAESIINLAGGINGATDFEYFKALSPEALLANPPDVILMFEGGLASLSKDGERQAAIDVLAQLPAVSQTPAGKNKRVITMDGLYLSGFGPRASDAALELATSLLEFSQ